MSTEESDALKQLIDKLLTDPQYAGHPLRDALANVLEQERKQRARMDRITRISDGFQAMLRDQKETLKAAATHDPLTGIGNRALLSRRLTEESKRAQRTGTPYCLAILDTDNFKLVNDTWGHGAGDRVLVGIAQELTKAIREYDICGRWGGEEFLVIMPETGLDESKVIVSRIYQAIASLAIAVDTATIRITTSIGITEHKLGENYESTLQRADSALMQAKRTGRSRCVYHQA